MPKVTEKRKHLNAFYFSSERNTEDKTKNTNHMVNKRMKNNMTEQCEKTCKSKVKSLNKLGQVYKSDNIVISADDGNGVNNLKLMDEEPKSPNSIKESIEQIVSFPSILINSEGISSDSMQFKDDTLKNVVNTKNPKASDKTIDLYQNMKKPLPSFMELEQILENDTDKLYSHKIKIPMKRSLFKIKEKDKISKSKQLLTKKQKNTEKKQIHKTSSLISETEQKPIPSFTELEQMFDDNINDNFKSFHITEQECTFKSPKSLRALVNNVIKLSTSRENSEKFATKEHYNIPVASKNLCLTSSNFHLNTLQQLEHNNSENYSLIDLEREGTSKICNILETDANNTNYYNDGCCQFKQDAKHLPFKDNPVLLHDEKEKASIYPETSNDTSIDSLNDGSNESSKTVIYDYNTVSPNNNKLRPFSPIPSTSSDNETFLKNDIRFNESLLQNVSQDETHTQSNVEVIEIPCETIILDDDTDNDNTCTDETQPSIDVNEFPNYNDYDYYTINIDESESFDNDCEIVDVDAVIDENTVLLEDYRKYVMNKINNCISPNPKITNSEPETANNVRQNDSISNTTSRNEIADVVTNFFTNQPQSSYNSLSHHTSANKSSVPANDFLTKSTRSVINSFIRQNSHTEVPQARHTTLNNTCDNVDIVTLDDTANLNNDSSDDVVLVSSTPPTRRTVPATIDLNQNMNNIHSRNGSMGLNNNTLVRNRHISNDKNSISETKGVINKRSAPAPTTPKVHNVGDCPICLENLLNVNVVASTNCGHMFCMKCIKTALKSSGRRCPTCRKILKGPGYHQLFFT